MLLKRLLLTSALISGFSASAFAQTTVDTATTTPLETDNAGDITIAAGGSIAVETGAAVTVNSDNDVTNGGSIQTNNADDTTGILIEGGNTGNVTVSGTISLLEDFTAEDTDGDGIADGGVAQGSGRRGILISGASPFEGNVTLESGSTIGVEGNESFGIQLASGAGLLGDISLGGAINMVGDNSVGADLAGQVIGNLANSGSITSRGEGAQGIRTTGGIEGSFVNSGSINNTGYRFPDRPSLAGRNLLGAEDRLQAGAAVQIGGDVSGGILLDRVEEAVLDADGNPTVDENGDPVTTVTALSTISQAGSAPAILIDGDGTPIAIGRVAAIIDPSDPNYDADLFYAFINEGNLAAAGVYNDINATAFEVRDATLTDGIRNSGNMTVNTFRSGDAGALTADQLGHASVIVLGPNAIADRINNSGVILATVTEAADEIYADRDAIQGARNITATAIDIGASASLSSITNTNVISAVIIGRNGEAIAVRDQSGTLVEINNSGTISAVGQSSDILGAEATEFSLVALDLSQNTTGVTITQTQRPDDDPDDGVTPAAPTIAGDILLGSGDDTVISSAGEIRGALAFGAGSDVLTLTGTAFSGALTDSDGLLEISVTNGASLENTATETLNVTSATFDGTSTFSPTLDGATGNASGLLASADITFEDGATISPTLTNVIDSANSSFVIASANALNINGDINGLDAGNSPFLYNTSYALDPNDPNTLIVTLDLRSTSELGLDTVQSAAFTSAFEALQSNPDLANALINIRDGQEFNAAFNQLLPEFSAASRQFVIANVDGAVGAVGNHLDSVRRSQEKPGGAWIQQFTYFADRDLAGLSEQYRGHGFGFTGGLDTALGPLHTVGINFGFASTEIEDVVGVDEPLDVVTLQAGLYAGYSTGGLGIEAYAGGGYNDFESNRVVAINDFRSEVSGDWSGTHLNGTLRAGYDLPISKRFWARPTVSLDYLSLREKGYTETGATGVALELEDRTTDTLAATGMINLGAKFMGKRTWIRPSVRAGYRQELKSDGVSTFGRFAGLNTPFAIDGETFPEEGFLLGFSVAAGSAYSSFGFDFDSDIRDGFIRHTGRVVVRLLF